MKKSLILTLLFLVAALPLKNVQAEANEEAFKDLIGRWMRPDGGYVLVIKNVKKDGEIDAAYLNPRVIHVSKAKMSTEAGKINVFVELQDRGYPGSYYTLMYDPTSDRLVGIYHHLGLNQNFDVFFVRE